MDMNVRQTAWHALQVVAVTVGLLSSSMSFGADASSGKTVEGLSRGSGDTLVLYSDPEGKNRVREVTGPALKDILPAPVLDEDTRFVRITADGGPFWVERIKVRVKQGDAPACAPRASGITPQREQVSAAGVRSSNDACRP